MTYTTIHNSSRGLSVFRHGIEMSHVNFYMAESIGTNRPMVEKPRNQLGQGSQLDCADSFPSDVIILVKNGKQFIRSV